IQGLVQSPTLRTYRPRGSRVTCDNRRVGTAGAAGKGTVWQVSELSQEILFLNVQLPLRRVNRCGLGYREVSPLSETPGHDRSRGEYAWLGPGLAATSARRAW